MPILSWEDALRLAQAAGFPPSTVPVIVAIAACESGLNSEAVHVNVDGSLDRGILQINSRWHPEVSDACAFDPPCAFPEAYRISNQGTSFTPWVCYNTPTYREALIFATAVYNSLTGIAQPVPLPPAGAAFLSLPPVFPPAANAAFLALPPVLPP